MYKASALLENETVKLSRGGLILIGLLNGGDYHEVSTASGILELSKLSFKGRACPLRTQDSTRAR